MTVGSGRSADPRWVFYSIALDLDWVELRDGSILFRGDGLSVRVDGGSVHEFAGSILPLLRTPKAFSELTSALPHYEPAGLLSALDRFSQLGVLRRHTQPDSDATAHSSAPWFAFLDRSGIPESTARKSLAALSIGIVGLEAHGAHLALLLGHCGLGTLHLIDPYPCRTEHFGWSPALVPAAQSSSRADAVAAAVARTAPSTMVEVHGTSELTSSDVEAIGACCTMLVACMDRGFSAAHHWVNQTGLSRNIPTIYSDLSGDEAVIGPLVVPGRTGCFMCYRMRRLACELDYDAAMGFERHLDALKSPALHQRALLPMLPSMAANLLGLEILKFFLLPDVSDLAGRIIELDALGPKLEGHAFIERFDCPACGGTFERRHPGYRQLAADYGIRGNLQSIAGELVSARTGLVVSCEPIMEEDADPGWPHLYAARLSNHRFCHQLDHRSATTTGKGLSAADAFLTALGEIIERYAASTWRAEEIRYARRAELDSPSLDPRNLVLYRTEQYGQIPYAPYTEDAVLGWTSGHSLVRDAPVLVPAIATFFNYRPRRPDEHLCRATSNGLAAGPSLIEAILTAAFEVIERDAYMISWFNRLAGQAVKIHDHPDDGIVHMARLLQRRGVELKLFRLPTDLPCHVFLALGLGSDANGPAAVVASGADPDPATAARKAVLELGQIRPGLCRRLRNEVERQRLAHLLATRRPQHLMDHNLLYASHQMLPALDFLLKQSPTPFDWSSGRPVAPAERLASLLGWLSENQMDLIYVNLTPPELERRRMFATRVIIPGCQPIAFGAGERRFGGSRLYELPVKLNLAKRPLEVAELNPDPHPMA